MPVSKQRKKHKVKKQKFVNANKEAKKLHQHRQEKYIAHLTEMFRAQQEAKLKEASTGPTDTTVIPSIVEGLNDLKQGIEEAVILDETANLDLPSATQ